MNEQMVKEIAEVFNGDIDEVYSYKSGPMIISFFNSNFGFDDKYPSWGSKESVGSRWQITSKSLYKLIASKRIDLFLTQILSIEYIRGEKEFTSVEEVYSHKLKCMRTFNTILVKYGYELISLPSSIILRKKNHLELLGEGGFAKVYYDKDRNVAIKKLKEEYLGQASIKHRFKREYEITKKLSELESVIEVYDFIEDDFSYTMEKCEMDLTTYLENELTDQNREVILHQVLGAVSEAHKMKIYHRDLSPSNILIKEGRILLSDFGLGKDLEMDYSHLTSQTNGFGQMFYCAPEQLLKLKEGDFKSDVFSLGRIINFIYTKSPLNSEHIYKQISMKCEKLDYNERYEDGEELYNVFTSFKSRIQSANYKSEMEGKVSSQSLDEDAIMYLKGLDVENIMYLIVNQDAGKFTSYYMSILENDEVYAESILGGFVKQLFEVIGYSFESYDPIARFANLGILNSRLSFITREICVDILNYISDNANRFYAQGIRDELIRNRSLDLLLVESLKNI